jgi:8-oxo-dGTP pyrophosphatase MutT (NUDIX family)
MRKAVSLALINNRKLLVVRKNLTWILPGGKPEEGETDIMCLERELNEELPNLGFLGPSYYGKFVGRTPHKGDLLENEVYFHISFNRDYYITPRAEISEARFCDYKELNNLNLSDITSKIIKSLGQDKYI